MPPVRRAPATPPPAVETVNFGSLGFYSGGFTLPKGKYALEFNAIMHAPTKQDGSPAGKPRLGVMVNAHPINADGTPVPNAEPMEQFFSMGSKADQSFAPDPTTGKGFVAVPGGPASAMNNKTNWFLFLKSLYDCSLPEGVLQNDFTVIDGVWVQTDLVPEPEDRKGFAKAATGEAAEEERKGSGLVPVVVEILEGGKPWEGSGGFIEAVAAPAKAPIGRIAPKAAAPAARAAAAPAPEPAAATDDDVMSAAVNGVTVVLESEPNGTSKLKLRTGTFKAVSAAAGADVAQAVLDTYFGSDDALNSVLGTLGFVVAGSSVKPQ